MNREQLERLIELGVTQTREEFAEDPESQDSFSRLAEDDERRRLADLATIREEIRDTLKEQILKRDPRVAESLFLGIAVSSDGLRTTFYADLRPFKVPVYPAPSVNWVTDPDARIRIADIPEQSWAFAIDNPLDWRGDYEGALSEHGGLKKRGILGRCDELAGALAAYVAECAK